MYTVKSFCPNYPHLQLSFPLFQPDAPRIIIHGGAGKVLLLKWFMNVVTSTLSSKPTLDQKSICLRDLHSSQIYSKPDQNMQKLKYVNELFWF